MPNLLKFHSKKYSKVENYSFNQYMENVKTPDPAEEKPVTAETAELAKFTEFTPAFKPLISEEEPEMEETAEAEESAAETEAEETGSLEDLWDAAALAAVEDFEEQLEEEQQPESLTQMYGEGIIKQAKEEAERILQQAREEAAALKEEAAEAGYKEGYQQGYDEGYEKSTVEVKQQMEMEARVYLEQVRATIDQISDMKEEILQKYKQDLKNIAIAIGEKVIHISLKSSGSVIEKMILSATEKLRAREWAKIYISRADADLLVRGDHDIMRAMSRLSDNLKVVAMENEKPGTCIIELPDEIIDASASTQVENIKEILKSSGI